MEYSNILLSNRNMNSTSSPLLPFRAIGHFLSHDCLSSVLLEAFCCQDEEQTVKMGRMTSCLHFPHIWLTGKAIHPGTSASNPMNVWRKRRTGCKEFNPPYIMIVPKNQNQIIFVIFGVSYWSYLPAWCLLSVKVRNA